MAAEKETEKTTEKTSEKTTEDAPKVDDKTYGTFKAMMTRFITEREDEESKTPNRTKSSEEKPKPTILKTLFGGE
jgi:hypothetical protein